MWSYFAFVCCVIFNQGFFIIIILLEFFCRWFLIQPETQVNTGKRRLLITHYLGWSIHFYDIGPWLMLYFPLPFCYISYFFVIFYDSLLMFDFCFVFMFLDNSLSNHKPILTFLLSFWLTIKLYHYHYGSIILYYIILQPFIAVDNLLFISYFFYYLSILIFHLKLF